MDNSYGEIQEHCNLLCFIKMNNLVYPVEG